MSDMPEGVLPDLPPEELAAAVFLGYRVWGLASAHGFPGPSGTALLIWLEDRLALADQVRLWRAEVAKLDPMGRYGASREETRPPGKFATGLRDKQAQSASQAMVLMADDLQRAYAEIARLKALLAERKELEGLPDVR